MKTNELELRIYIKRDSTTCSQEGSFTLHQVVQISEVVSCSLFLA